MPKVSIIMPAFNQDKFIVQSLESVFAQTYRDFELIVVNDGSTDDTEAVIQSYRNRITYIHNPTNQGLSKAMNIGSQLATGEYIVWLDSDDVLIPDMLQTLVDVLDRNPDLAFVSGGTHIVDQFNQTIRISLAGVEHKKTFADLFKGNFIPKLSTMARRRLAAEAGYFDENLWGASDYDLWLRLAKKYKFDYLNQILSRYRVHDTNMTKKLDFALKDHLYLLTKKEIIGGLNYLQIRIARARIYHDFAMWYEKNNSLTEAATCYKNALLQYPLVGCLYWPIETNKFRFSLPYRILRPFLRILQSPKDQLPPGPGLSTKTS